MKRSNKSWKTSIENLFKKKEGSRFSAFEDEEKSYLQPLPASHYEMAAWSTATIQPDYVITVGKVKYSVPYEFIGQKVDIRVTSKTIEVFYHHQRIASHIKKTGSQDPQILKEHMPDNHKRFLEYNKEMFLEWSATVGPSTLLVMKHFLASVQVEQQSYKTCASLMKLADRYSVSRIETACSRALYYTSTPDLRNIRTILKTGQDKVTPEDPAKTPVASGKFGFTRGRDYYGGEQS